ncbi:hypothetical protein WOSG25_061290 [Weissella oryzae SG25]|uniref:Uncharacterized protein n=1 Tax=Weissella oryzae (strain DSM 25784 / JCM 18191 / LMG 30913 / SG25) TaxID=1329250 RepID=A0A069CU18_WEIOS|nr:lipase chaperone [Weissella oryzae]GAK30999.1 hypothetical protein WOSG25_061290 [Weissella oryzae SG25]
MTVDYRDDTHIVNGEININQNKLSPEIIKLANYIRTKMYGVDVRESMALAVELAGNIFADDQDSYKQLEHKVDQLAQDWQDDTDNIKRQYDGDINKYVDEFHKAIAGVTADSEVIDARKSLDGTEHTVLKERLDAIELANIQHRPMNKKFAYDYLLQVVDLTTGGKDISYKVLGQTIDTDEIKLAYRTLRTTDISIERKVQ